MKRAGNLYQQIATLDNILLAFWKAQRGKSRKADVCEFRTNLFENAENLRDELLALNVPVGNYHYFTIHDPKKRVICAADFRERVLHHAIINVCGEFFDRYQIDDSFACQTGKGQTAAIPRSQHFARLHPWYIKLDIRKYFDSIRHDILLRHLERRFKDRHLLWLFERIIDSYEVTPGRGIPIGNLTSQYFANLYLASFDHFVKRELRCPGYVRYMDDFICFVDHQSDIARLQGRITDYLSSSLDLEVNPVIINKACHGIPFLGFHVLPHKLRLLLSSKRRFLRKARQADPRQINSLLAYVCQADTFSLRFGLFFPGFPSQRHEPG